MIAFFVSPDRGKVEEPVVIWKSGMPRCFRGLRHPSRTANVHYFSNPKPRMTLVMVAALKWFNRKLLFQYKKSRITLLVIWNQWYIHFHTQRSSFYLRTQPWHSGHLMLALFKTSKVKYGKRLVKYVLVRISGNSSATSIIKDGNILMGIQWAQEARKNKKQLKIILRSVEWSKVMTICWKLRKMT